MSATATAAVPPQAVQPPAKRDWTFDGVVRLTRTGTAYLIFTLVIGFAALNTGNNALYIGFTSLLGCLLLSGLASKGGLKHLSIELRGLEEVWAGGQANGVLLVSNRSRIWNVRDVVVVASDLSRPAFFPLLPRRRTSEVRADFVFERRGRVSLRHFDFYTRYPFGFFTKKRRIRVDTEVVVFPRLLADDMVEERFRSFAGDQSTANRPGSGSEIHSFRDYVRGDSLRQVYWKKSASIGRWIVKQTDLEAARTVNVIVDPYRSRNVSDERFERMISEAATFIERLSRAGADIVLTLPRSSVRVQQGQAATPLYHALALLEPVYEPLAYAVDRHTVVFRAQENA